MRTSDISLVRTIETAKANNADAKMREIIVPVSHVRINDYSRYESVVPIMETDQANEPMRSQEEPARGHLCVELDIWTAPAACPYASGAASSI